MGGVETWILIVMQTSLHKKQEYFAAVIGGKQMQEGDFSRSIANSNT